MIQVSVPKLQTTNNEGFTLIELLVVIAIIGLLAVIVMAGLQDSRDRAKNTKLNEIAIQYVNAFNLLTTGGANAFTTTTSLGTIVCLGYGNSDCTDGVYDGSETIDNQLSAHYEDMPTNEDFTVDLGGIYMSGIYYRYTPNHASTNKPQLEWYLKGDFNCPLGAEKTPNYFSSGNTKCVLELN